MPRASKKSRARGGKKLKLGPSSAAIETTASDNNIADASVKLGPHVLEQALAGPFMNLPVDIFLEMAAYCRPYDLLSLSRVSTKLRAVVLAKRNRGIWVCARNNLGLPMLLCPRDLSEPKYASMVFDRFCMVCGATWFRVDYAAHIRLCERCWETNVKTGRTILRELELRFRRDRSLKRVIFDLVPAATESPCNSLGPPDVLHQEPYLKFYQPEVVTIAREYQAVVQVSGGDLRVIEEYIERRMARTLERLKARHAFHSAMARWVWDYTCARQASVIHSFMDQIDDITRILGWSPETS